MAPTLQRVAGADNVRVGPLTGTAEDFSFFQQKVPGMFFFLGVTPRDRDIEDRAAEPFAAVLCRRIRAAGRRAGDDESRVGLFVRREVRGGITSCLRALRGYRGRGPWTVGPGPLCAHVATPGAPKA